MQYIYIYVCMYEHSATKLYLKKMNSSQQSHQYSIHWRSYYNYNYCHIIIFFKQKIICQTSPPAAQTE